MRRAAGAALRWPVPALLAWALAWASFMVTSRLGAPAWLAVTAAMGAGLWSSGWVATRLRKWVLAAGFPLSLLASGVAFGMPAWAWLLPLASVWLCYPRRAWRDAPLFPTPRGALDALPAALSLAPGARVLDAGCGLGHGLRALRRAYPRVRLEGVEWSWPLAGWARATCPGATVRRADLWADSWSAFDLVYLFQRPESMPRAAAKARAEMAAGAWLVSLEFEVTGAVPQAVLPCPNGRRLWLYRLPLRSAPASSGAAPGR